MKCHFKPHLDYTDSWPNIDQQEGKYGGALQVLKHILLLKVFVKLEHFIRNMLEQEAAAFDETLHLILLVDPELTIGK